MVTWLQSFKFVDVAGDGRMSKAEAQAQGASVCSYSLRSILIVSGMSDELFAAIDANGDGSITIDEFINYQRMSDEV